MFLRNFILISQMGLFVMQTRMSLYNKEFGEIYQNNKNVVNIKGGVWNSI